MEENMRELKFRAWDTVNKRFYSLVETRIAEMTHSAKDGVVYMQYTGIKDSKNREIYEGDLIKTTHNKIIFTVSWADIACSFYLHSKDGNTFFTIIDKQHRTVIGNIYETPDLLTN